jgi:hypothetical protein
LNIFVQDEEEMMVVVAGAGDVCLNGRRMLFKSLPEVDDHLKQGG